MLIIFFIIIIILVAFFLLQNKETKKENQTDMSELATGRRYGDRIFGDEMKKQKENQMVMIK